MRYGSLWIAFGVPHLWILEFRKGLVSVWVDWVDDRSCMIEDWGEWCRSRRCLVAGERSNRCVEWMSCRSGGDRVWFHWYREISGWWKVRTLILMTKSLPQSFFKNDSFLASCPTFEVRLIRFDRSFGFHLQPRPNHLQSVPSTALLYSH